MKNIEWDSPENSGQIPPKKNKSLGSSLYKMTWMLVIFGAIGNQYSVFDNSLLPSPAPKKAASPPPYEEASYVPYALEYQGYKALLPYEAKNHKDNPHIWDALEYHELDIKPEINQCFMDQIGNFDTILATEGSTPQEKLILKRTNELIKEAQKTNNDYFRCCMINGFINSLIAYDFKKINSAERRDFNNPPQKTLLSRSGTCLDYATLKASLLVRSGVNPDHVRQTTLKNKKTNARHAVVTVQIHDMPQGKKAIIALDNENFIKQIDPSIEAQYLFEPSSFHHLLNHKDGDKWEVQYTTNEQGQYLIYYTPDNEENIASQKREKNTPQKSTPSQRDLNNYNQNFKKSQSYQTMLTLLKGFKI